MQKKLINSKQHCDKDRKTAGQFPEERKCVGFHRTMCGSCHVCHGWQNALGRSKSGCIKEIEINNEN